MFCFASSCRALHYLFSWVRFKEFLTYLSIWTLFPILSILINCPSHGNTRNLKSLLNQPSSQMGNGSLPFSSWLILIMLPFVQKMTALLKVSLNLIRYSVLNFGLSFTNCDPLMQKMYLRWVWECGKQFLFWKMCTCLGLIQLSQFVGLSSSSHSSAALPHWMELVLTWFSWMERK